MLKAICNFLFLCTFYCFFSCDNREKDKKVFVKKVIVTDSFLFGEWLMDTILYNHEFRQEWAYFTDQNRFWKFSENWKDFIRDSNLSYRQDTVFIDNQPRYYISAIDSNKIAIKDNFDRKFYFKRHRSFFTKEAKSDEFYIDPIDDWLEKDSVNKVLLGTWKITFFQPDLQISKVPLKDYEYEIGSNKYLSIGDLIKFSNADGIQFFNKDSLNPIESAGFSADKKSINIWYGDAVSSFALADLSKYKMILIGNDIFRTRIHLEKIKD